MSDAPIPNLSAQLRTSTIALSVALSLPLFLLNLGLISRFILLYFRLREAKFQKNALMREKFTRKIWRFQKKVLSLHRQMILTHSNYVIQGNCQ